MLQLILKFCEKTIRYKKIKIECTKNMKTIKKEKYVLPVHK